MMNMACFLSSKRVSYTRDIHARFLGKYIPKMAFMAIMALLAVFSCLVKEPYLAAARYGAVFTFPPVQC